MVHADEIVAITRRVCLLLMVSKELHAPSEVQMGEASVLPYASMHPSAWKVNSANFRFTQFSAPLCQATPREGACESAIRLLKSASQTPS